MAISSKPDASTRAAGLIGVTVAMLALSWVCVLLRFYTRIRIIKKFAIDDWITLIAQCVFTAHCALAITGVHYGNGHHIGDLPLHQIIVLMKYIYINNLVYLPAVAFFRIAVGALFLRLTFERVHHMIVWVTIAIIIVSNLYYFIIAAVQCSPPSYFWTRFIVPTPGYCINPHFLAYSLYVQSAIGIGTDLILAALPFWFLGGTNLTLRKKLLVACVLGVGAISCIVVIARLPYAVRTTWNIDFPWYTYEIGIWSTTEVGIGLAAISLATLRPLFRRMDGKITTLRSRTSSKLSTKRSEEGTVASKRTSKDLEHGNGNVIKAAEPMEAIELGEPVKGVAKTAKTRVEPGQDYKGKEGETVYNAGDF